MAKVGEGEKRWIVEDRQDGKNVNSWHWTELDMLPKGKETVKTFFKNAPMASTNPDVTEFVTTSVDNFNGDMIFMNRKGKPIFVFDFSMKVHFKCAFNGTPAKGHINFKEICDPDWPDVSFDVLLDNESPETAPLKGIIKTNIMPAIKAKLADFITEMRAFKGADTSPKPTTTTSTTHLSSSSGSNPVLSPSAQSSSTSSKPATPEGGKQDLQFTLLFQTPTKLLYETLMDSARVSAFTQGPAEIATQVGANFKMFGGSVTGTLLELQPEKLIKQKWRFQTWPADHYSIVTYEFHPNNDECRLILKQTGIPENDFERTKEGWERFIWSRIKAMFGWHYKFIN